MKRSATKQEAELYARQMKKRRDSLKNAKGTLPGSGRGFTLVALESGRYLVQCTLRGPDRGHSLGTAASLDEAERLGEEALSRIRSRS